MLRLSDGQVESLWDELLPLQVRELPEDLTALDVLLRDPALFQPIAAHWRCEAISHGRPRIAMQTYVRLIVIKQRTGWGYETLMREVSDSLHLRRFCVIALGERVPDESTVRKLTRRLGSEVVDELTRCVIAKAQHETRFKARAARIDSTVVEADVRYPSDAALSLDGARTLARQARRLTALVGVAAGRVRDRSRALGRRLRAISRTMGRRTGERKAQVLQLTEQAGQLLSRSVREARRLALGARRRARGPWRAGQAGRDREIGGAHRPGRAGHGADQAAPCRGADRRSACVDVRPRRAPDPQGQARQAQRVRQDDQAARSRKPDHCRLRSLCPAPQ